MIELLITLIGAFTWLGYETNWLTVRLPHGEAKPKQAGYRFYSTLSKGKYHVKADHKGGNIEWSTYGDMPLNGHKVYDIIVSPGISVVLCGWDWLDQHCADMVDYQPKVELMTGGVHYKMTIKARNILNEVMKANKLTKKDKLRYTIAP